MKDIIEIEILTKTVDDLPIGVGIFHIDDLNNNKSIRYIFMNKVLLYEMRKTQEEVFGNKIIEVAPEAYEHEGGIFVIETYMKIAREGGSVNLGLVEYSNHMVAGTYECSVHHIKDNYVYVMLRNVTDLEKTKNDLEKKNAELSQFTHMVAHDLKAPLQGIYASVNIIEDFYKEELSPELLDLYKIMSDKAKRMDLLITNILKYCNAAQKDVNVESFTTTDLLDDILDLLNIPDNIEIKTPVESFGIQGPYTKLHQVLTNLIGNAIKYHHKSGGEVSIKINMDGENHLKFKVIDNGPGIPEEDQEKVFKFLETLQSTNPESTGIGLSIVKKLVEDVGGSIGLDSKPGRGSDFWFTWPLDCTKP
ncbi:sensor histidine kinase [Luteibaculum oceani]|uniref:histidine kinase n=1 Tax=Luteibaculum oceani TaxID=1294296 RepID=A0A5C6VA78_9FLAO|nr:HAMP domain-containing sensor histidine kinase [Luteibaculum oceani]TXC81684.1 HAMP domain-containing histidine kinase [Luteibaculum oceani]